MRHGGAEIAQQLHAGLVDEGEVHGEGPVHPVIPCIDLAVIAGIELVAECTTTSAPHSIGRIR